MSLACTQCGGDTRVARTIDDGKCTVRNRICKDCGYVQVSLEFYANEMKSAFECIASQDNGEKSLENPQ